MLWPRTKELWDNEGERVRNGLVREDFADLEVWIES